ncbi:hypothetical protein LTR22_013339 [Elasticomyces elasticus]|nr:hypothetical protein LTR22_013339 [Elasticomyces elasticus]
MKGLGRRVLFGLFVVVANADPDIWNAKYRILAHRYSDPHCQNKIRKEHSLVASGHCKSWKKDEPFQSLHYQYAAHKGDDLPYNKICTVSAYEDPECKGRSDSWNATNWIGFENCVNGYGAPDLFSVRSMRIDCWGGNAYNPIPGSLYERVEKGIEEISLV